MDRQQHNYQLGEYGEYGEYKSASWPVYSSNYYSQFRIRITEGHCRFYCCGFEIFGDIKKVKQDENNNLLINIKNNMKSFGINKYKIIGNETKIIIFDEIKENSNAYKIGLKKYDCTIE